MCRWLRVSASGFYDWRTREPSARAQRRTELAALVRWSFDRSRGTYGYRRIHADLTRRGIAVGQDLVRELVCEQGLVACQPRPFRITTLAGSDAGVPDLVNRDFTAAEPGTKLVGDITYIRTWAGFAYLATVIDCYSKAVIGWAVGDHMRTELIITALAMARNNHHLHHLEGRRDPPEVLQGPARRDPGVGRGPQRRDHEWRAQCHPPITRRHLRNSSRPDRPSSR